MKDRRFLTGALMLTALMVAAIAWPWFAADDPNAITDVLARRLVPPFHRDSTGTFHLLGTDAFGRDMMVRLWLAARISLGVGVAGTLLAGALGVVLGALAAWQRGITERLILSVCDMLLAVPRLVLLLVAAALWGPGLAVVVTVLGLTGWMAVMRLVRADVASVRVRPFVEGATALGVAKSRVLWRHVLPNALGNTVVALTLGVGNAILLESGLSFLGLGIQPPAPSWGNMIAGGREWLLIAPWIALAPGLLLIVTVVACTLIGDALSGSKPRTSRGVRRTS
jgi:peptide/nickel transport system permease protein